MASTLVVFEVVVVPLRVGTSPACRRVRRVVAPAGESLWCSRNFASRSERTPAARTFVASNESNQSKDAFHFAVPLRLLPSATCRPSLPSDHRTPVQGTPPLGSLRIAVTHDAKRGMTGKVCEANDRIALGPRGRPRTPSTAEQSALGRPPPSGSPFLGYFFWRSKRSNSPAGATSRRGLTQ